MKKEQVMEQIKVLSGVSRRMENHIKPMALEYAKSKEMGDELTNMICRFLEEDFGIAIGSMNMLVEFLEESIKENQESSQESEEQHD